MRTPLLIILTLLFKTLCAQTPVEIDAPVVVTIKGFYTNPIEKKTFRRKWKQGALMELKFNKNGQLVQSKSWGKQIQVNFNLMDRITQHFYDSSGKRTSSVEWENRDKNILTKSNYITYQYNSAGQLTTEMLHSCKNDSLFMQKDYLYNSSGQLIHVQVGATEYRYEYDTLQRIKSKRQLLPKGSAIDGWAEYYSYTDTSEIVRFDMFYKDSLLNHSKQCITLFANNRIVQTDDYYMAPMEPYIYRAIVEYNKAGFTTTLTYYRLFDKRRGFDLVGFIKFNYKNTCALNQKIVENINKEVLQYINE